jgi:hypothetical protein
MRSLAVPLEVTVRWAGSAAPELRAEIVWAASAAALRCLAEHADFTAAQQHGIAEAIAAALNAATTLLLVEGAQNGDDR